MCSERRIRKCRMKLISAAATLAVATVFGCLALEARAADHGDTPFLIDAGRPDARITDLYAFVKNDNLVIVLAVDPSVPAGATNYVWPTDVNFEIDIQNDANVTADPVWSVASPYGGTIHDDNISPTIRYRVKVDNNGSPSVKSIPKDAEPDQVFFGPVDDPFLRNPRADANVAAVVLEVSLDKILNDQSTILVWATAHVDGGQQELAGRAVRSQVGTNNCLNLEKPKDHRHKCGLEPDVMIYDTAIPHGDPSNAACDGGIPPTPLGFPNGRALCDDVDQIAQDQPLAGIAPETTDGDALARGQTNNGVPFQNAFPYLAAPH